MFNQNLHQTAGMLYEYLHILCPYQFDGTGYTHYYFLPRSSPPHIPNSDITQNYGNKVNLISYMWYQHLPLRYKFFN